METRLDSPSESWGSFSREPLGKETTPGRLWYDPKQGIRLEMVLDDDKNPLFHPSERSASTIYGRLIDGSIVTLLKCWILNHQLGSGGIGPTIFYVGKAIFGDNVPTTSSIPVESFDIELSSLSNWMCVDPTQLNSIKDKDGSMHHDLTIRKQPSITVPLPERGIEVVISQVPKWKTASCSFDISWAANVIIKPQEHIGFDEVHRIAWQCKNLMAMLIGAKLSVRAMTICVRGGTLNSPLHLMYQQVGEPDHKDIHSAMMLLPYDLVKEDFPNMVRLWLSRSAQAILATDIFFGSENFPFSGVEVQLLFAAQAAESYHRSLGGGLYMEQGVFDTAMEQFKMHIPEEIKDGHRESLKNKLKYANEYSLQKRLTELFRRLPKDIRLAIAGNDAKNAEDVDKFIVKTKDTRNYFTHMDHVSKAKAFSNRDVVIAAERLRILIVANLLHDLGIADDKLLQILERNRDFGYCMSQAVTL